MWEVTINVCEAINSHIKNSLSNTYWMLVCTFSQRICFSRLSYLYRRSRVLYSLSKEGIRPCFTQIYRINNLRKPRLICGLFFFGIYWSLAGQISDLFEFQVGHRDFGTCCETYMKDTNIIFFISKVAKVFWDETKQVLKGVGFGLCSTFTRFVHVY